MNQYPANFFEDKVGRLALPAAAKWRFLLAQREEVEALLRLTQEQLADLEVRRNVLEHHLASLDPANSADTDLRLREQLDQIGREQAALGRKRDRLNAQHANLNQIVTRLQVHIEGAYGWPAAAPVSVVRNENESAAQAVARIRDEIALLSSELARVKAAPPSRAEIETAVRSYVNKLAGEGKPAVLFGPGGEITISMPDISQFVPSGAAHVSPAGSASRLLAALNGEALYSLLMASVPAGLDGISADERARRVRELEIATLQAERFEEAVIESAPEFMPRRPEASPFAILGTRSPLDPIPQPLLDAAE
jgi:hypothetical protein